MSGFFFCGAFFLRFLGADFFLAVAVAEGAAVAEGTGRPRLRGLIDMGEIRPVFWAKVRKYSNGIAQKPFRPCSLKTLWRRGCHFLDSSYRWSGPKPIHKPNSGLPLGFFFSVKLWGGTTLPVLNKCLAAWFMHSHTSGVLLRVPL